MIPIVKKIHAAIAHDFAHLAQEESVFPVSNAAIEKENEKKAQLIYSEIDLNPLFNGFAAKADRSTMNATFTLDNEDLKDTFDTMWQEAGINGLNGHRSVGGYRASMYNALTLESVQVLVEIMSELERKA